MVDTKYPTAQEVEAADIQQLARWHRFLPTPGAPLGAESGETAEQWQARSDQEFSILKSITAKFTGLDGWNAALSKATGHDRPSIAIHQPDPLKA